MEGNACGSSTSISPVAFLNTGLSITPCKIGLIWYFEKQVLMGINKAHILDPVCFPISKKQESLSSQKILTMRYEKLEVSGQFVESRRRWRSGWFTKSSEDRYLTVQLQLGYQDRPCPTVVNCNRSSAPHAMDLKPVLFAV